MENKFIINSIMITWLALYGILNIIVPLQSITANIFFYGPMIICSIILALYNILIKKIFLYVNNLKFLILFFISNIITLLISFNLGFLENIKNSFVFLIYFFVVYPIFWGLNNAKSKQIFDMFFIPISIFQTLGVFVSIFQFLVGEAYYTVDYRGITLRQGFIDSRLFGIFTDPNLASIVSLLIIIYLVSKIHRTKIFTYVVLLPIFFNFVYIVFSGSRGTLIGLLTVFFSYIFLKCYKYKKIKSLFIAGMLTITLFGAYKTVDKIGEFYLQQKIQIFVEKNNKAKLELETNKSLNRSDVNVENISNNRFKIWSSVLELVPNRFFFGFSSGNWLEIASQISPESYVVRKHYRPHNGYIELLFYNGFVGLILIISFIFISIQKFFQKFDYRQLFKLKKKSILISLMIIELILVENLVLSYTMYGLNLLGLSLFFAFGYINLYSKE